MSAAGKPSGSKKSGGRKAGTPNKKTLDLIAILEERGYSPVAELIRVAEIAEREWERSEEIFDAIQAKRCEYQQIPLTETNAAEYLRIMQKSAAEIMPYMYPKRKALELSAPGGKDLFESFANIVRKVALES